MRVAGGGVGKVQVGKQREITAQIGRNEKRDHDTTQETQHLLVWHLDLTIVDGVDHVLRCLVVHPACNAAARPKDLLHAAGEVLGQGFGLHCPCNLVNLLERDVAIVLDVLLLLAVAWGL